MKKNIHPKYQEVLFVDSSTGQKMVIGSTLQTKETEVYEGKEYPVCRVSVSSSSHPFFTGSKQLVDAEGRVDKFIKRYSGAPVKQANTEEPKKQPSEEAKVSKPKKEEAKAGKAKKEEVKEAKPKKEEAKETKAKKKK